MHLIITNYFLNFFVIVSTISSKQHLLPEYLNSYMLEREKCNTVPFPWEPCWELIWAVTCLSCQEFSIFVGSLKWRSRVKDTVSKSDLFTPLYSKWKIPECIFSFIEKCFTTFSLYQILLIGAAYLWNYFFSIKIVLCKFCILNPRVLTGSS